MRDEALLSEGLRRKTSTYGEPRKQRGKTKRLWSAALMLTAVLTAVSLLYADQQNQISTAVQSWGVKGSVVAVLLMAVLHMTPVPSEGLLITYFRVYGIGWGLFYGWAGSVLSSAIILWVARRVMHPLLRGLQSEHVEKVAAWVRRKGALGLLFAHLLPMPAFIVNYAAGCIPAVRIWTYLWTAAVSIVPYYVGTALIYRGVTSHLSLWIALGALPLIALWGLTQYIMRGSR